MSSATFASWADSGKVTRDTLDTCVVEIRNDTVAKTYSVDMVRGVVIGSIISEPSGYVMHKYFYECDNGIYYLRKVICPLMDEDTTIENGGYEFFNVRITQVPVINRAKRQQERFAIRWLDKKRGSISLSGTNGPARAALFDMQGRRITPMYHEVNGSLDINRLCPIGGCPNQPLLLRIENGSRSWVFPAVRVR
jgi:hypothetical protein